MFPDLPGCSREWLSFLRSKSRFPVEKGSFDDVFLPVPSSPISRCRYLFRSWNVEWPRRSLNRSKTQRERAPGCVALPRCSHEEKSSGPLRRSFLPVSKSIKPTEVRNFPDQRYRDAAAFEDTRFLSICTNRRTFLFAILTVLRYDDEIRVGRLLWRNV